MLPRLLRDLRAHFSRAISPGGQAADEAVYGACAEIRRVLIFLAPGSPREGIEYQSYRLLLSGVIRFIEKRQAATPGTVVTTLEYLAAPLAAGEVMPNTLDPRAPQHPYVEKHYPYDPRAKKTA